MTVPAVEVLSEVAVLGAGFGLLYGLLGVGLVLAFRVSGVINLAHADIGVAGATAFAIAVSRWQLPYWAALPLALLLGAAIGAVAYVAVVHRLREVPALIGVVASLGLGQVLLLAAAAAAGSTAAGSFPAPPGVPTWELGALHLGTATVLMFVAAPVAVLALWLWLAHSRHGLELRAAAANRPAAQLLGLPATTLAASGWAAAGAVSVLTAVLAGAAPGFVGGHVTGWGLLLRALAAAVVAGMHSLPVALLAGVLIGVVEQVTVWNLSSPGFVDVLLFLLVVAVLLARPPHGADGSGRSRTWVRLDVWRPLPWSVRRAGWFRRAGAAATVGLVVLALSPLAVASHSTAVVLSAVLAFAIVGVSVAVVTGLGGMLSLGQFAFAGAGAAVSVQVVARTGNFAVGVLAAVTVGAVAATLAGLPAVRDRAAFLPVTTLAFAVAAESWLLRRPWLLGSGSEPAKPIVAGSALDTGRRYYLFALAAGAATLWVARNLRRSGMARRLMAVRDDERTARAFGIDTRRTTFTGVALGGAIAGLGGAVYGHGLTVVTSAAFPVAASVAAVALTVVGGLGMPVGPVIGALYVIGIPALLPLDAAWLAATAAGWLVLVLYVPAGLAAPLRWVRDRLACALARLDGERVDVPDDGSSLDGAAGELVVAPRRDASDVPAADVLRATGLRRTFAGMAAVDGVDIRLRAGEIVGLVGPNGAGKTTLVDLLAGELAPDAGRVHLDADDVTGLASDRRARRGLLRTFQEPRLFPTLTVLDAVRVAQEVDVPTRAIPALLGRHSRERHRTARARRVVEAFGLRSYAEVPVHALSTGTRRVCELACLASLRPRVLLLDEPSAGLAQAEIARLGPLLSRLRERTGAALLVVDHHLPLVTSVSDRILTLEHGRIVDERALLPQRRDTSP